jgi:hypothetical protein
MTAQRVVLPPPTPLVPDGQWWLVLDPDGVTVTLAIMNGTNIVASEVAAMPGGMRRGNLKVPGELKRMAVDINNRIEYREYLSKELGGQVTVELMHVGNMGMWSHD